MPSPIETLLRVHDSPVPTHTFFEFFGSIAMAPMDCTGCSSNTGRYRVPLSSDFHTPPLAAPTNSVILPVGSRTPAMAETRPLILAEPMLRAPRPEMVAELNGASSPRQGARQKKSAKDDASRERAAGRWKFAALARRFRAGLQAFCESLRGLLIDAAITINYLEVGKWKMASSTGTLASTLSIIMRSLSGEPLRPISMEVGTNTSPAFS